MTPLMRLKIAVLPPMPSASVSTAIAVNPGFFNNWRNASLTSFITQCLHGTHRSCPSRGDKTGDERDDKEQSAGARQQNRIVRRNVEQLAGEKPVGRERKDEPYSQADG